VSETRRADRPLPPRRIPAEIDQPDRLLAGLTAHQLAILGGTAALLLAGWHLTRPRLPATGYLTLASLFTVAALIVALVRHRDGTGLDAHLLAAARYWLHRLPRPHPYSGSEPARRTPPWNYPEPNEPPGTGVPDWLAHRATGPAAPWASTEHPARSLGRDSAEEPVEDRRRTGGRATAARLPVRGVTPTVGEIGIVDLGGHGVAVLAVLTPVPFAWAATAQQQIVLDSFTRLLCAIELPMQILIRALPLDLQPTLDELAHHSPAHPALAAAAADHHHYLTDLRAHNEVMTRQVILVLRDPAPRNPTRTPLAEQRIAQASGRLLRCLEDAHTALAPAGITLTALSATQAVTVLAAATHQPYPTEPSDHHTRSEPPLLRDLLTNDPGDATTGCPHDDDLNGGDLYA
jgi:hypothetical protein